MTPTFPSRGYGACPKKCAAFLQTAPRGPSRPPGVRSFFFSRFFLEGVDEAKAFRDQAHALTAYARQAQDTDLMTWATEIKVRAERKTGELLKTMAANEQRQTQAKGRPNKASSANDTYPKLKDFGISRDQSSQWQQLATMPEPEFERRLAHASAQVETLTTRQLLSRGPHVAANTGEQEWRTPRALLAYLRSGHRDCP